MTLDQEGLAAQLMVSRSYLSQLENGREPSLKLLELIRRLEVDCEQGDVHRVNAVEERPLYRQQEQASVDDLYAELHALVDSAIEAAGENPARVQWLVDHLKQNLRIPAEWLADRPRKQRPLTGVIVQQPSGHRGHSQERATG